MLLGTGMVWAAPTPVIGCTVISTPGVYNLTNDILNDGNTTCISITSSNVTFDGQGYSVDGLDTVLTYGIYVRNTTANLTNVTVKNLVLTDWQYGIYFRNTENGGIENNDVSSNTRYGIYFQSSSNNTISRNNASSNNESGIFFWVSSNNNTISDNTASSNNESGIYLWSSSNNILTNNTASSNILFGIYIRSSSNNNTISSNTASSNNESGIYLWSSSNFNTLTNNTANSNTEYGIYLRASSNNNTISSNTISSNNISGIYFWDTSNNNTISSNTISSNSQYGIYLRETSNNNTLTNNTVISNTYGIKTSNSTILKFNNVSNNFWWGLQPGNSNNITNNTITLNKFAGIYFTADTRPINNRIVNNTFNNGVVGVYAWDKGYDNATLLAANTVANNTYIGDRYEVYVLGTEDPLTWNKCVNCHYIGYSVANINLTSFVDSKHFKLNNISVNENGACWACHNNGSVPTAAQFMGVNKTTPWTCPDCHVPNGTNYKKYPAQDADNHVPDNIAFYNATIQTNGSNAYCTDCHQNSIGDTGGTTKGTTIGTTLIANVSHYVTTDRLVANSAQNCTYCHVQPNGALRTSWRTNLSLKYANNTVRGLIRHETNTSNCDNCHGNLSSSISLHSDQLAKEISVHYAFDWEGDDATDGGTQPPPSNRLESCVACHNSMSFGMPTQYKICEDCHLPNGTGPFTGPIPVGGPEVLKYYLRSDLAGWNISDREALGIPIIYSHVPYNQIQNSTTDIDVKRNLSGETGETGMNTRSSCFSWNPASPNGTCHGVGYSLRLAATPPEDIALGKEYFMHYGEKEYPAGTYYFNQTYMNTYIQDYSPNTSDCLFCHNQSNVSVRRFWGNGILIYYNRSNQSQYIGPSLMFNGTSNTDCYSCHTLSGTAPNTFHVQELTFGGGSDCVSCHDIGLTSAADVDVSKMNTSASPSPIHMRLNNQTGDPGFSDTLFPGNNDSKRCWACHSNGSEPSNMGLNYLTPWLCYDCHTNTTGGIDNATFMGNYSAPGVLAHIPANAMGNYSSAYQTNFTTRVQCWTCHANSVASTNDSEAGPELGHNAKSNVSHYGIKTFLVSNSAQNCTYCHVQPDANIRAMWGTNVSLKQWPATNVSFIGRIRHETNVSFCTNCHGNLSSNISLHSSQLEKDISVHYAFDWEGDDATDGGTQPPPSNRLESCVACHNNMTFGGAKQYKICEDCHLPNGTGPFTGPVPQGGPEVLKYYLRSDLSGWNISDREALGIPIIYAHVPYNSVWNESDVQVKRNLSGETGETGMVTRSSCFSWNPASPNGTCHGVGYSLRLAATPPEDIALGKEYFMHYGEKEYGTVGPGYFNVTYMNTYIPDYAPNTTDCLFCHNQSNTSVRRFWGNAIQVKLNSTGGYDANAMYGAQSNGDCYTCHVDSRDQPKTFHAEELNPGLNCEICHFNYTLMDSFSAPLKWINETLFNASVHGNRSILFCTNCHTMTEGHPPPESRWRWCEDCHVVMPTYADGTPNKNIQQRHDLTFQPQYSMINVSGTMTSVINITDCTVCHDTAIYEESRAIFNKTSGKNCRYCHGFPDLNIDSPY